MGISRRKSKRSENNQEALKRELKEELNIEINEMIFLMNIYMNTRVIKKLKLVFFKFFNLRKIQTKVHQQLKWIDISNLSDYDFLEGDFKIIKNY